jgi:hypothetical protein
MDDDITARRLRKKVLDRWENEGGRVEADPGRADGGGTEKDREGKIKERPKPHGIATTGDTHAPAKGRRPK